MRAVVLPAYGPPSALVVREVPEPRPGPGEIKVRVAAAGLNPVDWKERSGNYHKYMPLELPTVLGRDVSGQVVELGAGVTSPAVGTRVLGFVRRAYAEFVVSPVESWAEVPASLDLVDAAGLPLALLTGSELIDATGVREGNAVLVTGATGAVGRVAVYEAKARGAKVYAGVRAAHAAEAAELGVSGVVVLEDAQQLSGLPPLDALADTVGGETAQKLLGRLRPDGRIGSVIGETPGAKERGLAVHAFMTSRNHKRLAALVNAVAAGKIAIPIAKRFPFTEAPQAHAFAEKGGVGKVLLVP